MAKRSEEIKVGALMIVAAVMFLAALVFVGGVNLLRKKKVTYTTYFKFAGGVEPGNFVRFGGLKVGTVSAAEIDPQDSTRIRVRLSVKSGTPFRANSTARISTLGFLGENYIEVSPGTRDAPLLKPDSEIAAEEIVQLADVFNNVNNVTVNANKLVNDLDDRFLILANNANQLITNLNGVVSAENRQRIESALTNVNSMLEETRPHLRSTMTHLDDASAKLPATMEEAKAAMTRTNTLVTNLNGVVEQNREEIHATLIEMRRALEDAKRLMTNLNDTLASNRTNLDEALENIRESSQNLRQFTDTIKRRPFSLIRIKAEKERVPPTGK